MEFDRVLGSKVSYTHISYISTHTHIYIYIYVYIYIYIYLSIYLSIYLCTCRWVVLVIFGDHRVPGVPFQDTHESC